METVTIRLLNNKSCVTFIATSQTLNTNFRSYKNIWYGRISEYVYCSKFAGRELATIDAFVYMIAIIILLEFNISWNIETVSRYGWIVRFCEKGYTDSMIYAGD